MLHEIRTMGHQSTAGSNIRISVGTDGASGGEPKINRSNVLRTKRAERAIQATMEIAKKVGYVDLKWKNSKRAVNISKTIYGMVDELDSTDFCAQKDTATVVLLKDKSETVDQIDVDLESLNDTFAKQKSTDIVNLVSKIELEMGKFKYSRLKKILSMENRP